ncbi:hypothetical protein AB0P17_15605 [Streptomyces sp. NPDC088124]|uniref:hypothetical protein n=1 Tax=Streptomyces sp. NPDC088124 TaxID=3154654 RepID=UPI00341A92B5
MIVDPGAPEVTPPVVVTSPDGWLRATVDELHAGVVLSVNYTASTPLPGVAGVRKVRIMRKDTAAPVAVPVRSADTAWAVGGAGSAYDHEAPLGIPVIYTAVPLFEDGTSGPSSSLALTVPAPAPPADVWIKSLDEPGLSARVTVLAWPALKWSSRIDTAEVEGSPFPAAAQDVYGAAGSSITIDAEGEEIAALERLLTTPGVRLIQTGPASHRTDQYVLFSDPEQTLDGAPDASRTYSAGVLQVARPATAGQPLRIPGWSFNALAEAFETFDAVTASYSSFASLAVNGAL